MRQAGRGFPPARKLRFTAFGCGRGRIIRSRRLRLGRILLGPGPVTGTRSLGGTLIVLFWPGQRRRGFRACIGGTPAPTTAPSRAPMPPKAKMAPMPARRCWSVLACAPGAAPRPNPIRAPMATCLPLGGTHMSGYPPRGCDMRGSLGRARGPGTVEEPAQGCQAWLPDRPAACYLRFCRHLLLGCTGSARS